MKFLKITKIETRERTREKRKERKIDWKQKIDQVEKDLLR